MVDFFTVLMFVYNVSGAPMQMQGSIMFQTYQECSDAMTSDIFDMIYPDVRDTHIWCEQTKIISKTPHPQARPSNAQKPSANKEPNL